jgi:hypothetical protein
MDIIGITKTITERRITSNLSEATGEKENFDDP